MKILLASDFYQDWELYELEDPETVEDFRAWVPKLLAGDDCQGYGYTVVATSDDSSTEDAMREADLTWWVSDFDY